jgi:hypothetical protein
MLTLPGDFRSHPARRAIRCVADGGRYLWPGRNPYNLPAMKIAKRKKAQLKKANRRKFAQELLLSVQQAIAIRCGELPAGRRWRLTKLDDGTILRERLDVPPESPIEA